MEFKTSLSSSLGLSSAPRFTPQHLFHHHPVALTVLGTNGNFLSANITFQESFGWQGKPLPSSITHFMVNPGGFEEKRFTQRLQQFNGSQKSLHTTPSEEFLFALEGFSENIHYLSLWQCKDQQVLYTVVMTSRVGKHIFASFLPFSVTSHLGLQLSSMRSHLQEVVKKIFDSCTWLLRSKEAKNLPEAHYQHLVASLRRLEIYLSSGAFNLPGFSTPNLCSEKPPEENPLYHLAKSLLTCFSKPLSSSVDYRDFWQRVGASYPYAVIELPSLIIQHVNEAFQASIGGQEGSCFKDLFLMRDEEHPVKSTSSESFTPEESLIYDLQTARQAYLDPDQKKSSRSLSSLSTSKVSPLNPSLRGPQAAKASSSRWIPEPKVFTYRAISFMDPKSREVSQKTVRFLRTKDLAYVSILDVDQWLEGEYKKLDSHAMISTCEDLQSLWEEAKEHFSQHSKVLQEIQGGLWRLQNYLKRPLEESHQSLTESYRQDSQSSFGQEDSLQPDSSDVGLFLDQFEVETSNTPIAFIPPKTPPRGSVDNRFIQVEAVQSIAYDLSVLQDKWFLMVDDDKVVHRIFHHQLQSHVKSYEKCFNAEEAEKYIKTIVQRYCKSFELFPRGIVVIDYSMPPGDNGVVLVKKLDVFLKSVGLRERVLLLGNTANDSDVIQQFLSHGANAAYSKADKPSLIKKMQEFYPYF